MNNGPSYASINRLTKSNGSFKLNRNIKDGILDISTHNVRVGNACPGLISHKADKAFDLNLPSGVSSSPFDISDVTTSLKQSGILATTEQMIELPLFTYSSVSTTSCILNSDGNSANAMHMMSVISSK